MSTTKEQSREEVEFLKDQVQRLNALLSQYQRKYHPVTQEDAASVPIATDGQHASWLTNKTLLAPIMLEYDLTINELNKQITTYQSEVENLSSRVQEIVDENSTLHSELKRSLEAQLQASTGQGGGASGGGVSTVVVKGFQEQIDLLSKERDSYIDLWRQTNSELENLQKSEQAKTKELLACRKELVGTQHSAAKAQQTLEEMQTVCQQLDEERTRCLKTAKEQEKEVSTLQDNLSQSRMELKAAGIKNGDLKRALDEITLQLKRREAERQQIEGQEQSRDERLHLLQLTNADLEAKLLVSQRETILLKDEKATLHENLSALQSKTSSLEEREYEAMKHVKESIQIVETALMEKDQAVIRVQQLDSEIARLKEVMEVLIREAGERTSKEVTAVREEYNRSIDKMAAEVRNLEEECGEKQAILERVQREKKMVEKELERAQSQKPVETARTGDSLHELHKRVCVAERARDDALVKLENVNTMLQRAESNLQEEKKGNEEVEEDYRKRLKKYVEEMELLKEDKLKLMNECENFQQQLRHIEQSKEAGELRLTRELATLAQRHDMKEKELLFRLESSEDAHRNSAQQLRDMIAAQHRVGTRWREESMAATQKFEQTLAEVRSELMRYKRRCEELQIQMNHLKATKDSLSKQLSQVTSTNSALQRQLKEVEARSEVAVSRVESLLSKEKQLLQERRELYRQLDRMKLQMARNGARFDMVARGVNVGDLNASAALDLSKLGSLRPPVATPLPHNFTSSQLRVTSPQPHPHLDTSNWNSTLSELRHSIRQVKEELAAGNQRGQRRQGRVHDSERKDKGHLSNSDDDLDVSERSVLSRSDLSPHTSHSTMVNS